jgi:hypothetical protein
MPCIEGPRQWGQYRAASPSGATIDTEWIASSSAALLDAMKIEMSITAANIIIKVPNFRRFLGGFFSDDLFIVFCLFLNSGTVRTAKGYPS